MLLLLLQNLDFGGSPVEAPAVIAAGGGDDVKPRKKRRRGDRDHRWVDDPLYASKELAAVLSEQQFEEDRLDTVEAIELIAGSLSGGLTARGGLTIVPTPPAPVARAIVDLPSETPVWPEILTAIRDALAREKDKRERAQILAYRERVKVWHQRALALQRDEEDAEMLILQGLL